MNPFSSLCNEKIYIRHQDGRSTGPLKTLFEDGKFTVFDPDLDVLEGDLLERPLPNGKAEQYDIVHVHFNPKYHGIPPSYHLQVRKKGSLVQDPKTSVMNTNITIANSQGFQVGDHNTQNIVDSFKEVIKSIEVGPGTQEEKNEAKLRLKNFLEHPLLSAVVGGALSSLTGLL